MRGLLVGRFQPFHSGHLELTRQIRARAPDQELLIAIGSAEESYTAENPFTAGERFEMIERACREAGVSGITIVPVQDIRRHAIWVSYLVGLLPRFEVVYTNNPLTRLLFERANINVESPPLIGRDRFEGVQIRRLLAAGENVEGLVPPTVAAYLREIAAGPRLALLAAAPRRSGPPPGS